MNNNKINAVFLDCWDTLISFECNEKRWNILSLHQHCVNKDRIDWEEVFDFSENFFKSYYTSRLLFEIDISSILSLFVKNFDIELDCPIETCTHEILKYPMVYHDKLPSLSPLPPTPRTYQHIIWKRWIWIQINIISLYQKKLLNTHVNLFLKSYIYLYYSKKELRTQDNLSIPPALSVGPIF